VDRIGHGCKCGLIKKVWWAIPTGCWRRRGGRISLWRGENMPKLLWLVGKPLVAV
jgi:hypothetical protein